jgi:hypothetical protein
MGIKDPEQARFGLFDKTVGSSSTGRSRPSTDYAER